jgi:hypothetical protein
VWHISLSGKDDYKSSCKMRTEILRMVAVLDFPADLFGDFYPTGSVIEAVDVVIAGEINDTSRQSPTLSVPINEIPEQKEGESSDTLAFVITALRNKRWSFLSRISFVGASMKTALWKDAGGNKRHVMYLPV